MGDRSQVCIKKGNNRVFLYGHWIGSEIYKAIGEALRRVPDRWEDSEYLARAVFCEMLKTSGKEALTGETGFGIGVQEHEDIEHLIPYLDCDKRIVSFGQPAWKHNKSSDPGNMSFLAFSNRAIAGEFDNL